MTERKLIANIWRTPAGEILQSKHRHDFVMASSGHFIDGGLEYIRRGGSLEGWEDLCVYSDDTHEKKRTSFKWGSYGKYGVEPTQWLTLAEMETDHIWAILKTQGDSLSEHIREMFVDEIRFRKEILDLIEQGGVE